MTEARHKPGLFFEGVDIYGLPGTDSYWNMTVRDTCRALSATGEACEPFSLEDKEGKNLSFNTAELPPYVITWNFNSGRWVLHNGERMRIIYMLPVKNIVLLWDHPVHLAETIQEMRMHDQRIDRPPFHIGVMDDGHMAYLIEIGIEKERIFRWRQAGPAPLTDTPDITAREIDYIFHGTINAIEAFETFCQRVHLTDAAVKVGLQKAIEEIVEESADVYAVVRDRLILPFGLAQNPLDAAALTREVDRLTRDIRRFALLTGMSQLTIHYIGRIDPEFQAANPNGVFMGPLGFDAIAGHLLNAKVALYDTINFRDAAVMRLFYSIAHGCAPAAEMNAYLKREFAADRSILGLDLRDPAGNVGRLRDMVGSPARVAEVAEAAKRRCAEAHTWDRRIDPLLSAIKA